jgi:uncharacterized tellurite resistance protein B-like protein
MALSDRIAPLCDLLLGAAHADAKFEDREDEAVRAVLTELAGDDLPVELETQMAQFDPDKLDLEKTCGAFKNDPVADRARVLAFVAKINDSDDEVDFAEDEYLRKVCTALGLPKTALEGLVVDVEIEEMRADFEKVVRKPPPPPPGAKKAASVDVDLD